jgi:hypothetical protein
VKFWLRTVLWKGIQITLIECSQFICKPGRQVAGFVQEQQTGLNA